MKNTKYGTDQFKHMIGFSPASTHSEHSEFLGKNTCVLAEFFCNEIGGYPPLAEKIGYVVFDGSPYRGMVAL